MEKNPRELVGLHEVGERIGQPPNTVFVWRRRYKDFPAPIVALHMGQVYDWADVLTWLTARRPAIAERLRNA